MNHIDVIGIGSRVKVGDDLLLDGLVIQVLITSGCAVQYQVSWWSGNDRKKDWFEEFEVRTQKNDKHVPGFAVNFSRTPG